MKASSGTIPRLKIAHPPTRAALAYFPKYSHLAERHKNPCKVLLTNPCSYSLKVSCSSSSLHPTRFHLSSIFRPCDVREFMCTSFLIVLFIRGFRPRRSARIDRMFNILPPLFRACSEQAPHHRPLTPPAGADRSPPRHVTGLHNTHGRSSAHQAASHFLLSRWLPR